MQSYPIKKVTERTKKPKHCALQNDWYWQY